MKSFSRSSIGGGFNECIKLELGEKATFNYRCKSMGGDDEYELICEIIHRTNNYFIVHADKINDSNVNLDCYLDIYVLDKLNLTDDYTGLTHINLANTPTFNKYFDCVIYVNNRIQNYGCVNSDNSHVDILNRINCLDNCKLLSDDMHHEKTGWSYCLNDSKSEICIERINV